MLPDTPSAPSRLQSSLRHLTVDQNLIRIAAYQLKRLHFHNRVYKTIYARMKRGSITAEEFNRWKAEARYRLDQTRAGEMSEAQYEAWLTQDIRAWGTAGKEEAVPEQKPRLGE